MRVLAIESATIGVGVAIVDECGVQRAYNVVPGRLQTETLHPLIVELLTASKTTMADLDAIVVDIGPGLFTGLRVGIATAKTLAFALGVPVVGVTSTAALLAGVNASGRGVAVVDMRRSEVVYALDRSPALPRLCSPKACVEALAGDASLAGATVVGDGVRRHYELFAPVIASQSLTVDATRRSVDVGLLGVLGIEAYQEGCGTDPALLVPMYLRDADAKINWQVRDGSKLPPA